MPTVTYLLNCSEIMQNHQNWYLPELAVLYFGLIDVLHLLRFALHPPRRFPFHELRVKQDRSDRHPV